MARLQRAHLRLEKLYALYELLPLALACCAVVPCRRQVGEPGAVPLQWNEGLF